MEVSRVPPAEKEGAAWQVLCTSTSKAEVGESVQTLQRRWSGPGTKMQPRRRKGLTHLARSAEVGLHPENERPPSGLKQENVTTLGR